MSDESPIVPVLGSSSLASPPQEQSQTSRSEQQALSQGATQLIKKRRVSKGKIPSEIRRSASTPQIRSLTTVEAAQVSPTSDKRRNKLGYHRTSVACGHCRRRKIRCLLAPDDPQGRCSNCIRLKKECNFYPVEQEAQHSSTKPSTIASTTADSTSLPPSTSNPSSPRTIATSSHGSIDDFNSFPQRFAVTSEHEASALSGAHVPIHPGHPPGLPSQQYPYGPPVEDHWNPAFMAAQSLGPDSQYDAHPSAYWRPHDSVPPDAYGHEVKSSSGHSQPASLGSTPGVTYVQPDDGQNWPMPARAMSFSGLETISPQHASQQSQLQQHDMRSRQSSMQYAYPHPINTNSTMSSTSITEPLSAPVISHGVSSYGFAPPTWSPSFGVPVSGQDVPMQRQSFSHNWYPEGIPLQRVDEEHSPGAGPYPASNFYHNTQPQNMR